LALYYLDTSALVKLYIREQGTERLLQLAANANHRFAVLSLAAVELHSAVRRRARAGDIEESVAADLLGRFARHLESKLLRQTVSESVLEAALRLVDHYPLRAYDAVQLAGCLILRASTAMDSPVFVSADREQLQAAEAEGLVSLNAEP
jgi:predicted nucleic acid-binding protein